MIIDEQIISQIKAGNIHSLEKYFYQVQPRLIKYAKLFISNDQVAEDLVHESFICFWENRKKLQSGRSVDALLFTTIRNRCLNYIRDNNVYEKHLEKYRNLNSEVQHLYQIDFLGHKEESIEELLLKELQISIELLPEKCKKVFTLNKINGVKQSDIARELGITIKSVEKHIAVAKEKIRQRLEHKFPTLTILVLFFIEF